MNKGQQQMDVVIVGGGLAGLTLALQIRQKIPDTEILVLERRKHPVPEASFKVGESTVELAAHYFSTMLDLAPHLDSQQLPKLGLRYFFRQGDNSDITQRLEMGGNQFFPTRSYQIDRGRFENYLGESVVQHGVQFDTHAEVRGIELRPEANHIVRYLDQDKTERKVEAKWVIDATGRTSMLKNHLDLAEPVDHQASAIWFRLAESVRVDDWSSLESWQKQGGGEQRRWLSTNHLMGAGYWVWLIPLASGSTSIGIVADASLHPYESYNTWDRALTWMERHEPQCATQLRTKKSSLQDFAGCEDFAYGCSQVFSGDRWCLTGEAGLFVDPFYSPGSDFIALSNTFVTDLVCRSLNGDRIGAASSVYDDLYHRYFSSFLSLYQNQYPLFGDGRVMPFKIVWDFAYYWAVPAFLFFQGRLCDMKLHRMKQDLLEELTELNRDVQQLFREWEHGDGDAAPGFVDVTKMPLMASLNRGLKDDLDDEECVLRLEKNGRLLHQLAEEIGDVVERGAGAHVALLDVGLLEVVAAEQAVGE